MSYASLSAEEIERGALESLSDADLQRIAGEVLDELEQDRREMGVFYYEPNNPTCAQVHKSHARLVGVGGGNRSGKSDLVLAEMVALATGIIPPSAASDLMPKFRGPLRCRVVVQSLTTTLHATILPKLQWWRWNGLPPQGGPKGHWGWVPKSALRKGDWDESWSEKTRTLTVLCRDPGDHNRVLGESTFQFLSHDQDPQDFASGEFHLILLDEPPRKAIFTENQARTMSVNGRMFLAMTWPDDPAIQVDWIYDDIYDKGTPGSTKDPDTDWFEIYTTDNPNLDQDAVQSQMAQWSEETKRVRIYGQPIRFSARIHPLFTDTPQIWSFAAGKAVIPQDGRCPETGSSEIAEFCHVKEFESDPFWPVVFILDPHPRKPNMFMWAMIDPTDDVYVVLDGAVDGEPGEVARYVENIEDEMKLNVRLRLMDPNMGRSPASRRDITWQDEYALAGLACDLASDSDVGRGRVNEYLRPDPATWRPRLHIHSRCHDTVFQMRRYVWDNYRRQDEKDLKQKPRAKYDDYPTMLKYLMNTDPTFQGLRFGGEIYRAKRVGGY